MWKIKTIIVFILLAAVALLPSGLVMAASSEMNSNNYKMEAINFGQDVVLYSSQSSILPVISGEGPQISDLKASSVTITWKTDKSSSTVVYYGTTTSYGTQVGNFTERVKAHEVALSGLTPDTLYHYKVASEDRAGNIGESEDKTFTTPKKPAVSGLQVTDITLDSAIVSFTTATIVHATLNYGTTTSYGSSIEEDSGSYTTNHTIRLGNLTQGTTYNLKITGADKYNEQVDSDNYTFSTLPLPTVNNLSVGDLTANSAVVSWKTNTATDSLVEYYTNSEVTVENVERGEKQDAGSSAKVTDHSVKITALLGATVYYYKVISEDAHGNKVESGESSFTTLADSVPPIISKVKTESFMGSNGDSGKVQVTVTWETDELSSTQIAYGLGSSSNSRDIETNENLTYTTSHYMILQDLKPSSTYHVKAISRDPSGNAGESQNFTILTPKKRRSLLQLIAEKLAETFGWLNNLKV